MTEQQLQEMEAWFAEAACFDDCDEHDEAAIASLIADVRRLQQENAVLRNGVELQRCVVNAAYEDKCKAEQQRDAALAERDALKQEARRWQEAFPSAEALTGVDTVGLKDDVALCFKQHRDLRDRITELEAALTEARRVLRRCDAILTGEGWSEEGELRKDIAAVLAQEEAK